MSQSRVERIFGSMRTGQRPSETRVKTDFLPSLSLSLSFSLFAYEIRAESERDFETFASTVYRVRKESDRAAVNVETTIFLREEQSFVGKPKKKEPTRANAPLDRGESVEKMVHGTRRNLLLTGLVGQTVSFA